MKTSQKDLVSQCEFSAIILLQYGVIRASFKVWHMQIVLFHSTYLASIAVPVPLVLIPKYTAGCEASDTYS